VSELSISVIIPTLNAEAYIEGLLESILSQTSMPNEVIIIDSSSIDATEEIVRRFSDRALPLRFVSIPREEFSHGPTRNFAASLATGDILVFLTQDALPASTTWLSSLIVPFATEPMVACVFGRQIARSDANPIIALDIESHFAQFGNDDYLYQAVDFDCEEECLDFKGRLGWYSFNSNVNSAVRREGWDVIPFRDVAYAEDQLFGRDLIEAGYIKVYSYHAVVFHSHHYPLIGFLKRYFDEYRGLKLTLDVVDRVTLVTFLPLVLWGAIRDVRRILNRKMDAKIYWCLYSFPYHFVRRLGAYLGGRYEKLPFGLRKILSLEGRQ